MPRWGTILLVIILAGAAVLMFTRNLNDYNEPTESVVTTKRWVACSACQHVCKTVLRKRPDKCPQCESLSLWPARRCAACSAIVPMDLKKYDEELKKPYCPHCGGKKLIPIKDEDMPAEDENG